MAGIVERAKNAIQENPNVFNYPKSSQINITSHGSDVYWSICAAMSVSTIAFVLVSLTRKRQDRVFHYITAAITLVAAIAYFSMASNLGYAATMVHFHRDNPKVTGDYRQTFYVRYIDWFITTPLLLTDLLLKAGVPWPLITFTILADEIMIVAGLIGALVSSVYKFGFFVFAMVAFFAVILGVYQGEKYAKAARARDKNILTAFRVTAIYFIVLWALYPIAWGLCEGGNIIAPDSEAAFYAVLDFFSKPVFGGLLLWFHRNTNIGDLGCAIREPDPITRARAGVAAGDAAGTAAGPETVGAASGGTGQYSGAGQSSRVDSGVGDTSGTNMVVINSSGRGPHSAAPKVTSGGSSAARAHGNHQQRKTGSTEGSFKDEGV